MTDDDVDFEVGEPVLAGASGADSKSSESTPASLSVFDVMDDNEGEEDDELFRGPSLKAERKAAADALASYTSTEHKEAPTGAAEMTTSSVATATTQVDTTEVKSTTHAVAAPVGATEPTKLLESSKEPAKDGRRDDHRGSSDGARRDRESERKHDRPRDRSHDRSHDRDRDRRDHRDLDRDRQERDQQGRRDQQQQERDRSEYHSSVGAVAEGVGPRNKFTVKTIADMTREEKKLSRNDSDGGAAARPFVVTRQFKPYDTRARQAGDSAVTLPGPFAPLDFKNQDARTNLGIDCIASWRKALGRSAQTPTVQLKGHLFSAHMSDQENRIQLPFGPLTTAGRPKTNLRSVFELYVLLSDQFVADVAPMLASFKQVAFPEGLSGLDSFVLSTREPVKRDTLCSFVKLVIFMLEFARAVDSEQGVVVGKNARGDVRLPAPDKPDQYMTDFVFGPRIAHPRAADSPSNWALPRVNLIPPKLKDNHICLRFNSFNASFWMSKWLHHMLLFWRQPPLTGSFEIVFSVCNRAEFEFDLRRYVQSPVVPAKSTVQSSAAPSAASSGAASASALALKSTAAPMEVSRLVGASSHGLKITIPNDKASVAKGAAREEKETKGTTYEAAASAGGIKRKFEDSADSDQQSAAKRAKTDVADKIPSAAAASAMDTSSDESKDLKRNKTKHRSRSFSRSPASRKSSGRSSRSSARSSSRSSRSRSRSGSRGHKRNRSRSRSRSGDRRGRSRDRRGGSRDRAEASADVKSIGNGRARSVPRGSNRGKDAVEIAAAAAERRRAQAQAQAGQGQGQVQRGPSPNRPRGRGRSPPAPFFRGPRSPPQRAQQGGAAGFGGAGRGFGGVAGQQRQQHQLSQEEMLRRMQMMEQQLAYYGGVATAASGSAAGSGGGGYYQGHGSQQQYSQQQQHTQLHNQGAPAGFYQPPGYQGVGYHHQQQQQQYQEQGGRGRGGAAGMGGSGGEYNPHQRQSPMAAPMHAAGATSGSNGGASMSSMASPGTVGTGLARDVPKGVGSGSLPAAGRP